MAYSHRSNLTCEYFWIAPRWVRRHPTYQVERFPITESWNAKEMSENDIALIIKAAWLPEIEISAIHILKRMKVQTRHTPYQNDVGQGSLVSVVIMWKHQGNCWNWRFWFNLMSLSKLYARIRGLQLSLLDILKTAGKVTHCCDIFNLVHRTLHKVVCHRRRICLCKYAWPRVGGEVGVQHRSLFSILLGTGTCFYALLVPCINQWTILIYFSHVGKRATASVGRHFAREGATAMVGRYQGLNNWTEIVAEVEHSRLGTHMMSDMISWFR